ncbi:MAG TPA: RNA 2',3'-cyclic phosphodiesterase [Clostridiales bacterium]|nr:RNA 2',3'-cyclic phosphodiesterase [Clostridiales bacterium]
MRLFIAINFSDDIKKRLYNVIQSLQAQSMQGRMTKQENLHLTLVFLGEVETGRINKVKEVMNSIQKNKFTLSLTDFGYFKKPDGSIYWIGVEKNHVLTQTYNQLCDGLSKSGFKIEQREYRPHITLGRGIILKDNFDREQFVRAIPTMNMAVEKISLMKSEQIRGQLIYTEIYSVIL